MVPCCYKSALALSLNRLHNPAQEIIGFIEKYNSSDLQVFVYYATS